MIIVRRAALVLSVVILALLPLGCAAGRDAVGSGTAASDHGVSGPAQGQLSATAGEQGTINDFLKKFGLTAGSQIARFKITVPADWQVRLGEYPIGLYWALANEYSKDAGFDLAPLKGQEVTVTMLELVGGLPGEDEQAKFSYPTDIIVLTRDGKLAGGWLMFNKVRIGPSLRKRTLKEIAGLDTVDWLRAQGCLKIDERNADLALLDPPGVIRTYFAAIADGDKLRANACLSPSVLLDSLTVNKDPEPPLQRGFY